MKRQPLKRTWLVALLFLVIILIACRQEEPTTYSAQVIAYDLGETTIAQDHFPEESKFRNMPVRLDGVIGLPKSDQEHPVVLIMHGSHAACPGENVWPCSAEEEQKNYEGFTYLVEALAEAGHVALSINVNAEHTFGFGEAPPTVRTNQLVELHLEELAAANAGESDAFGLDLTGRVELTRMVWLGHSRGGEIANRILREQNLTIGDDYGPVLGLIQVAPSVTFADSLPTADLAIATLLPACDQDLLNLDGQQYYESARLNPERLNFATSVYLEGANHNSFNSILETERVEMPEHRPDCTADTLLKAEAQQEFLIQYTIDFLRVMYGEPGQAQSAKQRLSILANEQAPDSLYNVAAKVNLLPSQSERLILIQPQSEAELSRNLVGGEVQLAGATVLFCPEGYYVPNYEPGTEPCKRVNFNQPGYPRQFVIDWDSSGAEWRTSLPESSGDLTQFAALQLRAALDPLSDLNIEGAAQSFTVELVDSDNRRAHVVALDIEYPSGVRQPNEFFEGDSYTGHVFMGTRRIPLDQFEGVDLANIAEIALLFDQTESGTLFIADLELVRGDL